VFPVLASFPFCREFSLFNGPEIRAKRAEDFSTIDKISPFVECEEGGGGFRAGPSAATDPPVWSFF
jgi:hypothetical protein